MSHYRKIAVSELRTADIIVSTTDQPASKAIRAAIGADISHSMLYTRMGWVIEAIAIGVVQHSLELALQEATLAIALRRRHMDDSLRQEVVKQALQFEGRPYDKIGAVGAGMVGSKRVRAGLTAGCILSLPACVGSAALAAEVANNARDKNKDKMFFCSELVARAFELATVPIVDGQPTFTHPRDIRVSSKLLYVGHLKGLGTLR